jgi:hypothetical protein
MVSEFDMEIEELLTPYAKAIRSPRVKAPPRCRSSLILVPSKCSIHDVIIMHRRVEL